MNSIGALLGIVLFSSGCAMSSVETTRLNAAPHPLVSRSAQSVEVYSSSAPTRPHVDVALLRAVQTNLERDTARMMQSLAERAGELGCDAIFISGASERPGVPGDLYFLDPGSHTLFATCIAYLPSSSTTALAPATASAPAGNAIVFATPKEEEPKPSAIVGNVAVGQGRR